VSPAEVTRPTRAVIVKTYLVASTGSIRSSAFHVMPGFMPLYAGHPRLYLSQQGVDGRGQAGP
jgi:hypothetical protein